MKRGRASVVAKTDDDKKAHAKQAQRKIIMKKSLECLATDVAA